MADCTKTVEFLREWERMCHKRDCAECPIFDAKPLLVGCSAYIMHNHENAIAIVQKWSDEHPVIEVDSDE